MSKYTENLQKISNVDKILPIGDHIEEVRNAKGDRTRYRGVYLLPNLFTTTSLFAGLYSIISSINIYSLLKAEELLDAKLHAGASAMAIFIAIIFDGLDGRVARLTNTQSVFGAEYDSLSDMVAFGVAPALLAFSWTLGDMGKIGWVITFIYVAGAALRLARFNSQIGKTDKRYFIGLASPAAAGLVASIIWSLSDYGIRGFEVSFLVGLFVLIAAMLMVSNIKYSNLKTVNLKSRVPFAAILVIVMIFAVIFMDPPRVLLSSLSIYVISSPVQYLLRIKRRRKYR